MPGEAGGGGCSSPPEGAGAMPALGMAPAGQLGLILGVGLVRHPVAKLFTPSRAQVVGCAESEPPSPYPVSCGQPGGRRGARVRIARPSFPAPRPRGPGISCAGRCPRGWRWMRHRRRTLAGCWRPCHPVKLGARESLLLLSHPKARAGGDEPQVFQVATPAIARERDGEEEPAQAAVGPFQLRDTSAWKRVL